MNKKTLTLIALISVVIIAIAAGLIFTNRKYSPTNNLTATATPFSPYSQTTQGQTFSYDESKQSIILKNKDGASSIFASFTSKPLSIAPSSDAKILLVESDLYEYYTVKENSKPVVLNNVKTAVWAANNEIIALVSTENGNGEISILNNDGTSNKTIIQTKAQMATIILANNNIYFSLKEDPDKDVFINQAYDEKTGTTSALGLPTNKALSSVSPNGSYFVLAAPNAELKGNEIYKKDGSLLAEIPSTPFVKSFYWANNNNLLYTKDKDEPSNIESLVQEPVSNQLAAYDVISKKETVLYTASATDTIASFAPVDSAGTIRVIISSGKTSDVKVKS